MDAGPQAPAEHRVAKSTFLWKPPPHHAPPTSPAISRPTVLTQASTRAEASLGCRSTDKGLVHLSSSRMPSPAPLTPGVRWVGWVPLPTFQQQLELFQQDLRWGDGAREALGAGGPWGTWQTELKEKLDGEDI